VSRLIAIDGTRAEGFGHVLRGALTLSATTGRGFEVTRIRAAELQPGLRASHVAAVRAAALTCGARTGGAFEGSPDLRFEPGPAQAGEFRFEIAPAGPSTHVLQVVAPVLATADAPSRVELIGGTHVAAGPSFDYVERHWRALLERAGLRLELELVRAGFSERAAGEVRAVVHPWRRPASLHLEQRGALLAIRGLSLAGRLKGDVARRQRDAAQERLWEARRLEAEWELREVASDGPGSALVLEAVYEVGRGAFGLLGERRLRPEAVGDRGARRLLRFLDAEGAVDGPLAEQLAVPLAVAGGGGRVSTAQVTVELERVAALLPAFGFQARLTGLRGAPGLLEIAAGC
jgi:RNA 3'-terminal phosphate cyclase (ATP)